MVIADAAPGDRVRTRSIAPDRPAKWNDIDITRTQARDGWPVRIAGTGGYLPGVPIANSTYLEGRNFPTTAEWIEEHTGVEHRHHAGDDTATSDLAAEAARGALAAAGIEPSMVERIILCTTTGDWTSPAAASRVQHLLGAQCPAVDVQAACASWIFGLDMAIRLVATGLRNVLVIGADVKSRFVSSDDHRLGPVLADGAGAVVLDRHEGTGGFLQVELYTDGSKVGNLFTPAGGSAMPASAETVAQQLHATQLAIAGSEIKEHASFVMAELSRQVCRQEGIEPSDVDWLVPHQANAAILRHLSRELEIDPARIANTIARAGNIVAGTLPFSLDDLIRRGEIEPGQLILLVTAGAGYAGGVALYEVPA